MRRRYGPGRTTAPRFWPEKPRRRRPWVAARPFLLAGVLAASWTLVDPALVDPIGPLATAPEWVSKQFTRCGVGRGFACVIDGDTFKLGARKVRIIGIDAPETHPPRCAEEARLGEAATVRLMALLNDGPFDMVGSVTGDKDRYGRDLRAINRPTASGTPISIAAEMRASGLARRYLGGFKPGWC